MDSIIKQLFDENASYYDAQRRQLIPCFDDFYGAALSLAVSDKPNPHIVDLGAGTGLFSSMILQKYPSSHITLVDLSDQMLDKAKERFKDNDQIRYIVSDYTNFTFSDKYDIVISSLSIHHLTHPAKRQLFSTIYQLLNEGGVFVNADQVAGSTPELEDYNLKCWLTSVAESGIEPAAIEASMNRRQLDINATLRDQLQWMEEAGFHHVDCMYRNLGFGVFVGHK